MCAPLSTHANRGPDSRTAYASRSAWMSSFVVSSSRASSPGCGVTTVGADRAVRVPDASTRAFRPSASTTSGAASSLTSFRATSTAPCATVRPGPKTTASNSLATSRISSVTFDASVCDGFSGKPDHDSRRELRLDDRRDRLGNRKRDVAGAHALRSHSSKHSRPREIARACDNQHASAHVLVGIR